MCIRDRPKGEHMDFIPGSYAQIKIPKFSMDYDKDIDKSLIEMCIRDRRSDERGTRCTS